MSDIGLSGDVTSTSSGFSDLADAQSSFDSGSDEQARSNISSVLANVGNRSNVRGSVNYDPLFAQAFNMSRGLQPGNLVAGDYFGADKFQGIADLARPSYLQPQVRGADGTMYFSQGERFLQETLPPVIQQLRKASPTGIIQNLIEYGTEKFNETFGDDKKSDSGIMETIDRADLPDYTKAMLAGMENTNRNLPQATQTAFGLKDVQNMLTSPGAIGKALELGAPTIRSILPEGLNFDAGTVYNPQEQEFQPRMQFRYDLPNKDLGLGSLFRNLG
jgi:hypothetical protein